MAAHVTGSCSLARAQADQIAAWIEDVTTRTPGLKYAALPAVQLERDEISGRVIGRKFSCAGFVLAAYEEAAGIVLLVPEASLPEVNKEIVIATWMPALPDEVQTRIFRNIGLEGPGPWRLLLPGYLFHALKQWTGFGTAPYQPKPEDSEFA